VISPIFAIPKPNQTGEYRVCIDLRYLNSFLSPRHFKLDSLESALRAVSRGAAFSKTDIASAFSHVRVAKAFRKYLGFRFAGQTYTYLVLPFGMSLSPYLFCKTLRPVIRACRAHGITLFAYVDDILIVSSTVGKCQSDTHFLRSLLTKLGWKIREEKSTQPSQEVQFLGFVINSLTMTLGLPSSKARKLSHEFRRFAQRSSTLKVPRRVAARVCGLAASVARAVPLAAALSRRTLFDLRSHPGPWDSMITISPAAVADMATLAEAVGAMRNVPITQPPPTRVLRTDASLEGWGMVCMTTGQTSRGTWGPQEELHDLQSINFLEMLAVKHALTAANLRPNEVVMVESDSATTVAYLRRWAGRQPHLFELAREILTLVADRNCTMLTRHLPGVSNSLADGLSRQVSDWEVLPAAFTRICSILQVAPTIDRFATPANAKTRRFNSRLPHPMAEASNSLLLSWRGEINYWAPPLALLGKTVTKISQEGAKGVLLTPPWEGEWLPYLLTAADAVLPVPTSEIVQSTGSPFETTCARLLAWRISGTPRLSRSTLATGTLWSQLAISPLWEPFLLI
jgi:ribonuclease HI